MHTAQTRSLGELGVSCFPLLPTEDFRTFMGNWDQNLQQTEGTNPVCILVMVVLFISPLFRSHLPCAHMQPCFNLLVIRLLWSNTQHLSDEYVSRAWCNSTHQRGVFEKHVHLLEFSGRSVCKEMCHFLNSEYLCSCYQHAELPCTLHTNFSFIQEQFLFLLVSLFCYKLWCFCVLCEYPVIKITYSIIHKVEWFWSDSDIKYSNRKIKT